MSQGHDTDPESGLQQLGRLEREPSPRVLAALRRELADAREPVSVWGRSSRLVLSALWLTLCTALFAVGAVGAHGVGLLASALALGAAAAVLLGVGLPGPRRRLALGARRNLIAALTVGLLACLAASAREFLPWGSVWNSAAHAGSCFRHALGGSLLGAAGLLWLWRGTDPFTPTWTGALLGAIAGLVGALAVSWVCASSEGWHLLIAHGSGALLVTAVVAALCHRWLRP